MKRLTLNIGGKTHCAHEGEPECREAVKCRSCRWFEDILSKLGEYEDSTELEKGITLRQRLCGAAAEEYSRNFELYEVIRAAPLARRAAILNSLETCSLFGSVIENETQQFENGNVITEQNERLLEKLAIAAACEWIKIGVMCRTPIVINVKDMELRNKTYI